LLLTAGIVGAIVLTASLAAQRERASAATQGKAATCSLSGTYARDVKVYKVNAPPYEYRVQGVGYVSNPGARKGCILIVCEAEELGKGNWVPSWCTHNAVASGVRYYYSMAPYIDCQNYGGTGYFRSYVRYEGSGVRLLGPPRFVCT
jgi:hypothetical protein